VIQIKVKATDENIEVKKSKAFEAGVKSKRVRVEADNGSKFITVSFFLSK
jgi:hypothetical protein